MHNQAEFTLLISGKLFFAKISFIGFLLSDKNDFTKNTRKRTLSAFEIEFGELFFLKNQCPKIRISKTEKQMTI
ncbi:hypothetical protein CH380_00610 [Leptospira adleri]|uniref:Uncharacterized protein n=1 Tax=Leptospira adleri TaxID=2023186 RepID=A0A2M9YU47_9LEPT|nr:hypothetical protein CH380_00610 [Leptospira adleri]PJZ63759.1 hypothetical protein CH376_01165 [Leptospira adleri]